MPKFVALHIQVYFEYARSITGIITRMCEEEGVEGWLTHFDIVWAPPGLETISEETVQEIQNVSK